MVISIDGDIWMDVGIEEDFRDGDGIWDRGYFIYFGFLYREFVIFCYYAII
jgi:hypothetical protein